MRTVGHSLYRETPNEQRAAGRYNPAWKVNVDGFPVVTIGAGSSDDVWTFVEGVLLIVLSRNTRIGYIAAEVFDVTGERIVEHFSNNDEIAAYLLGLTPIYAAKRISNWLDMS